MSSDPFFSARVPGLSEPVVFNTHRDLIAWIDGERENWQWLWSEPSQITGHTRDVASQSQGALQYLMREALESVNEGYNFQTITNALANAFGDSQYSIFASQTVEAQRVFNIHEALGADHARYSIELQKNRLNFNNLSGPTLPLLVAAAGFDEQQHGSIGESLARERANFRSEISKLRNRVAELEREHSDFLARERSRSRRLTRRLVFGSQRYWRQKEALIDSGFSERVASIRETEDHYRTQMALQAPVQYWREKAKGHRRTEYGYAALCLLYFVLAAFGIALAAEKSIEFLQGFTGARETSAYVITAGALLGGTTLIFWLGRLLVKLFLSEHHLRSDSEEKSIMTQAFLAMGSREQEFTETERSIILASIFRSSPDGIVKEEGPGDFGANALLAKLLMR